MKAVSKSEKVSSASTNVTHLPIRVKRTTFEKMTGLLAQVNKKEFGKRVGHKK